MSEDESDLRGRTEEGLAIFRQAMEFTRDLLRENAHLRKELAALKAGGTPPSERPGAGSRESDPLNTIQGFIDLLTRSAPLAPTPAAGSPAARAGSRKEA